MSLSRLLLYKKWANGELIEALRALDPASCGDQRLTAIRILNHTHVVDRIFQAHLLGRPHTFKNTNTDETPEIENLAGSVRQIDEWYVTYIASVLPNDLAEVIHFTFTDGDRGSLSRENILLHVVNHGSYHRGAIGRIIQDLRLVPPKDTYARFLQIAPN